MMKRATAAWRRGLERLHTTPYRLATAAILLTLFVLGRFWIGIAAFVVFEVAGWAARAFKRRFARPCLDGRAY